MKETAEITTVIDAFDDDDAPDANLLLGFEHRWKSAPPAGDRPSRSPASPRLPGQRERRRLPATDERSPGADIGIFRDLALRSACRSSCKTPGSLDLDGSSRNLQRLQDPSGDRLHVPFRSPSRSGLDTSGALNYAIFNQQRRHEADVGRRVEGRLGVGVPLAPIGPPPAPDPSDAANPAKPRWPSRATNAIVASTVFSAVRPSSLAGFSFLAEFAQDRSDSAPRTRSSSVRRCRAASPPVWRSSRARERSSARVRRAQAG